MPKPAICPTFLFVGHIYLYISYNNLRGILTQNAYIGNENELCFILQKITGQKQVT